MTTIWIDAQLSPSLAAWINASFENITASSVRSQGLLNASDKKIFQMARESNAIVMTKDDDFIQLQERYGPPPFILWITCGNSSNAYMRRVLELFLIPALKRIGAGEPLVEIGG